MTAGPETTGGEVHKSLPATLACREHRTSHEIDVVTIEDLPDAPPRVTAIGEVKAVDTPVGANQLARLEHLRELIPSDRVTAPPKLLLFSWKGFTTSLLRSAEGRTDVELIDLNRLYNGD